MQPLLFLLMPIWLVSDACFRHKDGHSGSATAFVIVAFEQTGSLAERLTLQKIADRDGAEPSVVSLPVFSPWW